MWNIKKLIKKGSYDYALVPEHPYATTNGYVLYHRVVMENNLGRLLNTNEVVHHIDGNKHNNDITNLELLNCKEHSRKHQLLHGRKYLLLKCPYCGTLFERPANKCLNSSSKKHAYCSKRCRSKFNSFVQHHGLTHEMQVAISENIVGAFTKHNDNTEETAITGSVETTRNQAETPKI